MAEKGPICKDKELGEALKESTFALLDSLEKHLKEQGKQGLPVEEGLKKVRKAKRYLRKILS